MTEPPRVWTTPSLDLVTDAHATAGAVAPVRNEVVWSITVR